MEESELITQIRQGNPAAFHTLYNQYKLLLAGRICKLVQSPDLAEDILQEVFMRVWEHRRRLNASKSIRSYLFKITENLIYDYFRKLANHTKFEVRETAKLVGHYAHIEESIYEKESKEWIQRVIDKLPMQCRHVFVLFRMEGKSYNEITEALGISKSTINNHLLHAKKILRRHLLPNKS